MILLLSLLYSASASVSFGGGIFTIDKLILTPPDKVRGGENVTLTLIYNSPVEINKGTVTNTIIYGFIPFSPTTSSLCDVTPCPITVGRHDSSSWAVIPCGVRGQVNTTILWKDHSDLVLMCIKIGLDASIF